MMAESYEMVLWNAFKKECLIKKMSTIYLPISLVLGFNFYNSLLNVVFYLFRGL